MTLLANMSSVSQKMIYAETHTDYKGRRRRTWHAGFYFFEGWDGLMSELIFPARSTLLDFFYVHKRANQRGIYLASRSMLGKGSLRGSAILLMQEQTRA